MNKVKEKATKRGGKVSSTKTEVEKLKNVTFQKEEPTDNIFKSLIEGYISTLRKRTGYIHDIEDVCAIIDAAMDSILDATSLTEYKNPLIDEISVLKETPFLLREFDRFSKYESRPEPDPSDYEDGEDDILFNIDQMAAFTENLYKKEVVYKKEHERDKIAWMLEEAIEAVLRNNEVEQTPEFLKRQVLLLRELVSLFKPNMEWVED